MVAKLNTFFRESHPSEMCKTVSIKEMAQDYTRKTGKPAVLVTDGNGCVYHLYNTSKSDWMMGGQLILCKSYVENFIASFKNINVDVIFYFDGATPAEQRGKWIHRREERRKIALTVFKYLKGTGTLNEYSTLQPSLVGATGRYMVKNMSPENVRISIGDCDQELVRFAKENNCFAILADDTDFALLGSCCFLKLYNLNLTDMTTWQYDGKALAKELDLELKQMPLLGTLLGCNALPMSDLNMYHLRIAGIGNRKYPKVDIFKLIRSLADFVRRQPVGEELMKRLKEIARDELQNVALLEDLRKGVEYFSTEFTDWEGPDIDETKENDDPVWQEIMTIARSKYINCEIPTHLLNIIAGSPYELSATLENYADTKFPCTADAYLKIRHRIYSILLHEKSSAGDKTVEEWCVSRGALKARHVFVEPVQDCLAYPGLVTLWTNQSDPAVQDQRWELFVKSVSLKLDTAKIRNLPQQYIILTCVLFFIQNEMDNFRLDSWEVDAFLSQAVDLKLFSHKPLLDVRPPARAVQCGSLFSRGVTTIILLLGACGFSLIEFMPWNYYDGILFLQKYRYMQVAAQNSMFRDTEVSEVTVLRHIIEGTK